MLPQAHGTTYIFMASMNLFSLLISTHENQSALRSDGPVRLSFGDVHVWFYAFGSAIRMLPFSCFINHSAKKVVLRSMDHSLSSKQA